MTDEKFAASTSRQRYFPDGRSDPPAMAIVVSARKHFYNRSLSLKRRENKYSLATSEWRVISHETKAELAG